MFLRPAGGVIRLTREALKEMVAELHKEVSGNTSKQFEEQTAHIKRLEDELGKVNRRHTADLVGGNMPDAYAQKAKHVIKVDKHQGAGLKLGRYVRALALAKMAGGDPREIAKAWGDNWLADAIDETRQKALAAGTMSAGGALVPDEYRA